MSVRRPRGRGRGTMDASSTRFVPRAGAVVLAVLVTVAGAGLVAVEPALGGSSGEEGPVEPGSWSVSAENVSTLYVRFTPNASDPHPSVSVEVDNVTNRTDEGNAVAAAVLWNETRPLHVTASYTNHEDDVVRVRAGETEVPPSVVNASEGATNVGTGLTRSLNTSIWGSTFEVTLLAEPEASMRVNLTMPGGGTVEAVEVDPGPANLSSVPSEDWDGVWTPFPAAYRFSEETSSSMPLVAVGSVGNPPNFAGASSVEVETPEGCVAEHRAVMAVFVGVWDTDVECPADVREPKLFLGTGHSLFLYRGFEAGTLSFEGVVAEDWAALTYLATGGFPPE